MPNLSIADVAERFPDFRVALVVADNLAIAETRSAALAAEIADMEGACRARWGGVELSAIPGVAAWRAAYKGFGIKRTSYRSSVERLIKRVLAGGALPEVNALVDLYNAVSLSSELCLGCDDLDRIEGDLEFRFSRDGRHVSRHGRRSRARTPTIRPKSAKSSTPTRATCCAGAGTGARTPAAPSRPTRAAPRSLCSRTAVGDVEAAAARLAALIERECGGRCRIVVAERGRPVVGF